MPAHSRDNATSPAQRAERVREALGRHRASVAIHYFESVASTSGWLAQLSLDQPTLVIADGQTQGRGRQGRAWQSPRGGLYFSVGLPVAPAVALPPGLSLGLGLQLVETLASAGYEGVQLKWPNDLVVADAKLAGLLVERLPGALLVGVGLNADARAMEGTTTHRPVIGLHQLADRPADEALVGAMAAGILEASTWSAAQIHGLLQTRWPVFDALVERSITVVQADGERLRGRVLGVTPAGNLRLQTASGERHLSAGECHIGGGSGERS